MLTNFTGLQAITTLNNLLVVNGIFSAVLITYLFNRIESINAAKKETFTSALTLTHKVTDYRRILHHLTEYYGLWNQDSNTKSLVEGGKFGNIDFYDFRLLHISDHQSDDTDLIETLRAHPDFREGKTTVYLAMSSLIKNRKDKYYFPQELYNDYPINRLYNPKIIKRWLACSIMHSISYWMHRSESTDWIQYQSLKKEKIQVILEAACRINPKYSERTLDNSLVAELSDELADNILPRLYRQLKFLKKGIFGVTKLVLILVLLSLIFGVLIPFLLLFLPVEPDVEICITGIVGAINIGLIAYLIIRLPVLIAKQLRW